MQPNPLVDVTASTQTEEDVDTVDSSIVLAHRRVPGHYLSKNNLGPFGFISSIYSRYFSRTKGESLSVARQLDDRNTMSTQTEERDPVAARGQYISYLLMEELVLDHMIYKDRDEVVDTLSQNARQLLTNHPIALTRLINKVKEDTHYLMFESVANELFEPNSHNEPLGITWSRVITLIAFTARLGQEYKQDYERVSEVTRYLALYISKHVISYVKLKGGWKNLVVEFPAPMDVEQRFQKVLMWSGLFAVSVYVAHLTFSRKVSN